MRKPTFVSLLLLASTTAHAQPRDDDRARFSGKRFVVEILGGELVGSLVTGVTFNALCNGRDCLGSAITAFGANVAVTPLAVWGIGQAMGGDGSLGYTYLGGSTALAAFSVPGPVDESPSDALSRITVEAWVSSIMLAPCSAALYELTSHVKWSRDHAVTIGVAPHGDGAMGMIGGRW